MSARLIIMKFRSLEANKLILSAFILLFVTACFSFLLKTSQENYISTKKRSTDLKTEITLKQGAIKELQQQLKSLQPPLRLIQSDVMEGLFKAILQLILSSDLSMDSYYPMTDRKHRFYTERSFSLTVTGDFDQLVKLVNKIQAIDALLMCDDFNISKRGSGDKLQMHLIIKGFCESRSSLKKIRSFTNQLKPTVPIKLENFSLDSLLFVGLMRQKNKVFALISTPDASISLVKTGDYIGNHHGKIILIKDQRIHIREDVVVGSESSQITTLHLRKNLK